MSSTPARQTFWIPHTNVFISNSGQLIVQLDLSGVESAALEVTDEGGKLKIAGHRRNLEIATAKAILINDISYGPFESVLELPAEFDAARSSFAYVNGVLRIVVPNKDSSPAPELPPES